MRPGATPAQAAATARVTTASAYTWLHAAAPDLVRSPRSCFRCVETSAEVPEAAAYAQLLGLYLGDGCLSWSRSVWVLRITCCDAWPGIADEAAEVLGRVCGNRVQRARKAGCHDVQAYWKHCPCLLPQHGPGKKHDRPIVLEPWQRAVVTAHAGRFLRGLFHSDGWRGENVAVRRSCGTVVRYRYSRYEFSNRSADIRLLCTQALDELGIAWRPNGPWRISVARRAAVAALDDHVGPKS